MQDLLERYTMKRMLNQLIIKEKLFTLESINNLILDFNYGANEVKNKPNFLMTKELVSEDHGLNQSGEI